MSWTVAIGVDTHKDMHVAVACDALGRQLDSCSLPATSAGYLALWRWAETLGEPAFAVEGAGSYGAGLARFLRAAGGNVYECERPRRRERRGGKSDLIDAALAARRLLAGEGLSRPRGDGAREDLRLLLLERRGVVRAQTAALNQLHSALLAAPASMRERLSELHGARLVAACARVSVRAQEERVLVGVLRRLVSSGDPARMRSESSFAALAGTSPVDASSGRHQRHRLNRGGDRQLNRALHVIALNRVRHHGETSRYYGRLLDSGKSAREARRCVKRALARSFYRRLCELPRLQEVPLRA